MNRERIEMLAQLIPCEAPYSIRKLQPFSVPAEVDIIAHATNDPGFGWMFVKSCLDHRTPLPAEVSEPELIRPYLYVRDQNKDRDAREALGLRHSTNRQRQIYLRCLLVLPEYDYATAAQMTDLSEDTVRIYEALHWNVKDRLDDRIYITSLAYPDTRRVEFLPSYLETEDTMYLALRAAIQHGIPAVEELLGMRNPAQDVDANQQASSFAARTLSLANFMAKLGFLNQDLPIFDSARRLLRFFKLGRPQEHDRVQAGVERAGVPTLNEAITRIIGPAVPGARARKIESENTARQVELKHAA